MDLSKTKFYSVVSLAVIALVGILVVQVYLVDSAYNNEKKKFYSDVKLIGIQLQNAIKSDSTLKNALIDLGSHPGQDSSRVDYYKDRVASIADSLFRKRNNDISYEFGLVTHNEKQNDCCHLKKVTEEKIVFSTLSNEEREPILQTKYHTCASTLNGFAHLNFYYPNLDTYLIAKISDIIVVAVICTLIVAGCLAFAFRAIREQKKLAELKTDFINNMTHELKTPIFSISLASQSLRTLDIDKNYEKAREYLDLIIDENKRLKSQVHKVLEIGSIESNGKQLKKEQVDVHQLIRKVVSTFDIKLTDTNDWITLKLKASNSVIYADKTHLHNVLNNLLDNAVKYSRKEPEIIINTKDNENGIVFSIIDNGIGMNSETKKRIFDKFYRAQTGNIHDTKGFGLGLSYVKQIVDAHQGWIKLKSKLQRGSRFTVFLPAK